MRTLSWYSKITGIQVGLSRQSKTYIICHWDLSSTVNPYLIWAVLKRKLYFSDANVHSLGSSRLLPKPLFSSFLPKSSEPLGLQTSLHILLSSEIFLPSIPGKLHLLREALLSVHPHISSSSLCWCLYHFSHQHFCPFPRDGNSSKASFLRTQPLILSWGPHSLWLPPFSFHSLCEFDPLHHLGQLQVVPTEHHYM